MMNRRVVMWTMVACALLWSGCGAARPIKYYQLTVPGDISQAPETAAFPITLLVGPLSGSNLYREDRIVYGTGEAMGTYDTHRWASAPTQMMQEVLFRELRASGRYKTVNTLRSNARGDYLLQGRIYDFKEITGNGVIARVAVEYELKDTKTGTTVWSHYYAHDEPGNGKDVSDVVAAIDRNVQGIVGQVKTGLEQYFTAHPVAPTAGQ